MIPETEITTQSAKDALLRFANTREDDELEHNWYGTLNEANLFRVADLFRSVLEGKVFAISTVHYADSGNPDVRLQTDCYFNSEWTDRNKSMVRVYCDSHPHIAFSAGGYLWSMDAAPGNGDHENYRYTHLSFEHDTVKFISRSGSGDQHIHIFRVQHDNDLSERRQSASR